MLAPKKVYGVFKVFWLILEGSYPI